jgi:predicted metalloprotease with PDZ domain
VQLEMMKAFPVSEYHFLILLLPYKFYHGVEHTASTVLALGPGYALMTADIYNDLVGVASHELFHVWNVKTIRPAEMLPYRYQEENYSRTGWVFEGFTTYYGDLFLARSGFFSMRTFFDELSIRLQRHMDNPARLNNSVADSGYDTWLDGYNPGVPGRKTSIYDEGCLIAMVIDLFIRKHSEWKFSLDDVMLSLYHDFGLKKIGYKEHDIKKLIEHYASTDASSLFSGLINSPASYDAMLSDLLSEAGCYIRSKPSQYIYEREYGFRIAYGAFSGKVTAVYPGSPAYKAGLSVDDELICLNGIKIENNLNELLGFSDEQLHELEVFSMKKKKSIRLQTAKEKYFNIYTIEFSEEAGEKEKKRFASWTGIKI